MPSKNASMSHPDPLVYPNWREIAAFTDDGPTPFPFLESDRLKAVIVGLKAGQSVPHHRATEGVYHFLQGGGTMTVNAQTVTVESGTTVIVPDGAHRGIDATKDMVFLGTRCTDTTQHEDHDHGHHNPR